MLIRSLIKERNLVASLFLRNGVQWYITAEEGYASALLSQLSLVMQLSQKSYPLTLSNKANVKIQSHKFYRNLFIQTDSSLKKLAMDVSIRKSTFLCTIGVSKEFKIHPILLIKVSGLIVEDSESRGGILIHGALIARDGCGVILAGPGGRGKTTASRRLPDNWQSFCDDATLVVPDKNGQYWAHPYPTWSNLLLYGLGESWDMQYAVPLKGIFFLEQDQIDSFKSLSIAQNVCSLLSSTEQNSWLMPRHSEKVILRKLRLQRFDNICSLAESVPAYVLRLSKTGAFWNEIEQALHG